MWPGTSYGLGWMISTFETLPMIFHGGNTFGFSTDLAFLPTADVGVVVMTNAQYSNAFGEAVRSRVFELALGLPATHDDAFRKSVDGMRQSMEGLHRSLLPTYDAERAGPFEGAYANPALGNLVVEARDGGLRIAFGQFDTEVRQQTGDTDLTFFIYDPPLATIGIPFQFRENTAGEPVVVFAAPEEAYTFKRKGAE